MNKKLCWFLDIIYFVITFFVLYFMYYVGIWDSYYAMNNIGQDIEIWRDLFPLMFKARDMIVIPFFCLLTSLLDFSFVSKILTHLKCSKRTQLIIFIILCIAVVVFGVATRRARFFVPMIW